MLTFDTCGGMTFVWMLPMKKWKRINVFVCQMIGSLDMKTKWEKKRVSKKQIEERGKPIKSFDVCFYISW